MVENMFFFVHTYVSIDFIFKYKLLKKPTILWSNKSYGVRHDRCICPKGARGRALSIIEGFFEFNKIKFVFCHLREGAICYRDELKNYGVK